MTLSVKSFVIRLTLASLLVTACKDTPDADAYGNFEAEEVVVSAETSGQLVRFEPLEGRLLSATEMVALVDTIQLSLERAQLLSQRDGLRSHREEINAQLATLRTQHEIARRTRERIDRLFAAQAATAQQRDQTERDERTLNGQLTSMRLSLDRTAADLATLDVRLSAVADRLRRATIANPVAGTVLATYVRRGEIVQAGQPLYRIANLDTLTLRAYVSGSQLAQVKLGQTVVVHIDGSTDSLTRLVGTVAWISARAEFTPTPVQTRDARGDLVYAIKVRVANPEGVVKIGMPGDVTWQASQVAASNVSASDSAR